MTVLTRKGQEFTWGPKQQEAFQYLKDRLCTAPALAYQTLSYPSYCQRMPRGTR
jgi:hypothetical protein